MDKAALAGLKRKYAATQEPAKRAELANLLRTQGVDPDEAPAKPAPEGRKAPEKVTAEAPKPDAKAAAAKDEGKPRSASRPGRPAKNAK